MHSRWPGGAPSTTPTSKIAPPTRGCTLAPAPPLRNQMTGAGETRSPAPELRVWSGLAGAPAHPLVARHRLDLRGDQAAVARLVGCLHLGALADLGDRGVTAVDADARVGDDLQRLAEEAEPSRGDA